MIENLFSEKYSDLITSISKNDITVFKETLDSFYLNIELYKQYCINVRNFCHYSPLLLKYERDEMMIYALNKEIHNNDDFLDVLITYLYNEKYNFNQFKNFLALKGNFNSSYDLSKTSLIINLLMERDVKYFKEFVLHPNINKFDYKNFIEYLNKKTNINQESFNYLFETVKGIDKFFICNIEKKSQTALDSFLKFFTETSLLKKEILIEHIHKANILNKEVYDKILLNDKLNNNMINKPETKKIKI